ncbi:hypothetical protein FACS1894179_02820 [Bacteroidia bacterium]|nr:hypothetical protein FACS1894179_02820 [Bacteroidia bacterium]
MGIYGQQQTYPVQVYTQLIPPYTPHIPAYYIGTQAKLKVMLINTDMQQPVVNVYLRMKILSSSFSAVTPPEIYTPQIELQAGMPITLSLNDLEPYFKKENLRVSGGQSEFYRTQMLPDNFYRFHFEVYEAGTNRLVSNPKIGFAQAMIASGEPPILNLPQKGSVIKESAIPSIMFSWTPKHMNSIAAAYGTEYDISLVEIYDKQVAPEAAFDYSRVLYTETTKSTSFIHTIAQPLLIPGMRYAWRVQAKAREGVDEISVFKNNGYSPVSWFDYTADCKTVQSCGAIYENGHVDISWQDVGAMEYTVEYRKKGTSRWYTGTINKPLLSQLYNLQAGKDYEYRIGSRCVAGDAFRYNDLQAFHIPDRQENGPNCGLMPDISLTNRTPARKLQSGMPVLVGDFPVFITKVSGSGRFTGEGYVGIPYLQGAQIAVTFKDIVVNTDNRLVEGFFETKYDTKNNNLLFDADQYQTGGKGVGDIRSGEEQAAFKVDYVIDATVTGKYKYIDTSKDEIKEGENYQVAKGENGYYIVTLTDTDGNEHELKVDSLPATVVDKEGKEYEVKMKEGEVKALNTDLAQLGYTTSVSDSIYSFKIIREKAEIIYKPNSNIYVSQNNIPITISLLKKDSIQNREIPVKWTLASILDTVPKLSVSCNVNNIGNVVIEAIDDSIRIPITVNVYEFPNVDFSVNGFNGSFGFDKYIGQYTPHINNSRQEDHQVLVMNGITQYIPNVSLLPNQPNVRITATFSNYANMQKDSLLNQIKIYSSNGMVKLSNSDTLVVNKTSLGTPINFEITTNNTSLIYDSVMLISSLGKTIGKLNIYSQPIIQRKLLLVHIQTDSVAPSANFTMNLSNIKNILNNHSYNQAFIEWNITTKSIPYDSIKNNLRLLGYNQSLKRRSNSNNPLGLFTYANAILTECNIVGEDKVGFIINDSVQTSTMTFEGLANGFGNPEFVMSNDNYDGKKIGHELGHCLKLHHPFGTENKIPEELYQRQSANINSTENVMDYDHHIRMHTFWLWQWIIMNNNIKYYER